MTMPEDAAINPDVRRSLAAAAWIAVVFSVVVAAGLLFVHFTAAASDPWKSPRLLSLKERLSAEPRSDPIKTQIREEDFLFRQRFRRRLAWDRTGALLLVCGALASVALGRAWYGLCPAPALPAAKARDARLAPRDLSLARWSVAGVAGAVVLTLETVSLVVGFVSASHQTQQKPAGRTAASEPLASVAELQANWPRFRGWDGSGMTRETNFPISWNEQTGEGVGWKTPILAPGHNSPVVWDGRVFITGGSATQREVFCYRAETGALEWRRVIEHPAGGPPTPDIPEMTGWAASTAATDGRRLYAIFANGDLAGLDFSGAVIWSQSLGPLKNMYGHGASLATWQGLLIVQLDQGQSGGFESKLLGIDGATGRIAWTQSRPGGASWATPIIFDTGGRTELVASGQPWVIAYTLPDCSELWRANLLENEVVPSPIFAAGRIFAISPSSKLLALNPAGSGDVTKTAAVWSSEENVPDICSPVSNDELVFTVTSVGLITCFDAENGAKIWEHDLAANVQASPAIFGRDLFILGQNGAGFICAASRDYQPISTCQLNDEFLASPAFAGGRIFLRGETNLYCLGSPPRVSGKERADARR